MNTLLVTHELMSIESQRASSRRTLLRLLREAHWRSEVCSGCPENPMLLAGKDCLIQTRNTLQRSGTSWIGPTLEIKPSLQDLAFLGHCLKSVSRSLVKMHRSSRSACNRCTTSPSPVTRVWKVINDNLHSYTYPLLYQVIRLCFKHAVIKTVAVKLFFKLEVLSWCNIKLKKRKAGHRCDLCSSAESLPGSHDAWVPSLHTHVQKQRKFKMRQARPFECLTVCLK